jgi:hypothetical protein
MATSRDKGQFGVEGDPIGYSSGLAIRLIFIREIEWAPSSQGLKGIRSIEDRQIKLHDLARSIGGNSNVSNNT